MKTKSKRNLLALGGVAAASLLAGLLISSKLDWTNPTAAAPEQESANLGGADVPGSSLLAKIARDDTPSVVNISTTKILRGHRPFGSRRRPSPFDEFFGQDDVWERFFGEQPERDLKQHSLGSGFIVDKEGYILTNNHVVAKADDIKVTLSDGRSYTAEVKGTDSKTDIALIKIEAENHLPVAALGDSEKIEVGEWVMAIGNPFGLNHTVTVGVVSGKGRILGTSPYDNFIQTDASINPGNSGGPLINMKGEVVGINTLIFASGQGLGFAIPINLAKEIMGHLRDKGTVTRGWLGVQIQTVTPELAESLGLPEARGALIAGVFKGDPADEAGIKVGDVVVEFDGKAVEKDRDLVSLVGSTLVGKKAAVKVIRDGKEVSLKVDIAKRVDDDEEGGGEKGDEDSLQPFALGIKVQDLTEDLVERFGLDDNKGILVTEVESGSAADKAGVSRGDIIVEAGRSPVTNIKDFRKALKEVKKGEPLLLLVKRGQGNLFLVVKPEKEKD
jgi:serine protease Do